MALFFKLLAYFSRTKFYLSGAYAARFSATRHGRKTLLTSAFSSRKKTNFRNCKPELLNRAVEILDQLCREFFKHFLSGDFAAFWNHFVKLCVKIRTKTKRKLCVSTALKKVCCAKRFLFFSKLCVEAIPAKQNCVWKLCVNFEHKSAWSITAVITYGWIFLALCSVFTFFI